MSEGTPGSWPDEEGESMAAAPDAVSAAEGLTGALETVRDELKATRAELHAAREASEERDEELRQDAVRRGRIIAGLVLSLILDVMLTGVVTVFAFQANSASTAASLAIARESATIAAVRATQISACRSGNVAQAKVVGIWTFVLDLSGPPKTARERQIRTKFLAHLHSVYRPRNCAELGQRIYRLP